MERKNSQDVNSRDGFDPHDRRPLPSNLTAEQILIGGIFMSEDAYDVVSDILTPEHFFDPLHSRIYSTIEELLRTGQRATPVTLAPFFVNVSTRSGQSMTDYLGQLASAGAPRRTIKSYAQTIYDLALRRQLIETGKGLVETAYDMPVEDTPIGLIEKAEQDLYSIADAKQETQAVTFAVSTKSVLKQALDAFRNGGRDAGLSTGLKDLDGRLGGGLQPGQLIVLAARPGMGKTALAVNMGYRAAKRARMAAESQGQDPVADAKGARRGVPVGFFSLEMTDEEIARRVLAEESGIRANDILAGTFMENGRDAITEAYDRIQATPFFCDPTGGISVPKLAMRARRMKRQHNIGMLIVDYLQLVTAVKRSGGNRVQEIGEISGALKALAKELAIPVVALSQLSRDVEKRDDKRPNLSDLRDGGTIEQDADVVIFIYREEYYWLKANPRPSGSFAQADWETKYREEGQKGVAELIAAKQRNGPTGTIRAQYDGEFTRFTDLRGG